MEMMMDNDGGERENNGPEEDAKEEEEEKLREWVTVGLKWMTEEDETNAMRMEEDERLKRRGGFPVRGFWAWRNEAADGEEENGKGLGIMRLAHGKLRWEAGWAVTRENKPCKLGRAQEKEMRENGERKKGMELGLGGKRELDSVYKKEKKRKGKKNEGGPGC